MSRLLDNKANKTNLRSGLLVEVNDKIGCRLFADVGDCVDFVEAFVDNCRFENRVAILLVGNEDAQNSNAARKHD